MCVSVFTDGNGTEEVLRQGGETPPLPSSCLCSLLLAVQ